ncbi:MAG: restriction endonuclease subunit S [Candidatus Omnitrophota bacterium]
MKTPSKHNQWQIFKIKDITNNLDNRRIPLNEEERWRKKEKAVYPYYGANGQLDSIDEYIYDEKILCIAEDGGDWRLNKSCAYIVNEKCWVNNHAHVLTARPILHLEYLMYFLNYSDLSKYVTGTTRGKLTKSALDSIPIPLPPLSVQKRIAAVLDKADRLRRLRKAAIEKLDQLTQSVFLDIFGDPVTNPKGWETVKLADISSIVSGVTKGKKNNGRELINLPYMRVANVQDGYLDLSEIKTIDVTAIDANKYKLEFGDILLTEGGDPDKLGRGEIWRDEIDNCIYQNHIFRVRADGNLILPEYLNSLIGSYYGKKYFLRESKQTTGIATINSRQLKEFPVLLPGIELQKEFKHIVNNIRIQMGRFSRSLNCFNILFNSLLQRAFKGELSFNDHYFQQLEKETGDIQ